MARFGIVAYSDDGVAWTTVDASNGADGADGGNATHDLEEVIWDGSKFIVASNAGILTSTDGAAWVKNTDLFNDDMSLLPFRVLPLVDHSVKHMLSVEEVCGRK